MLCGKSSFLKILYNELTGEPIVNVVWAVIGLIVTYILLNFRNIGEWFERIGSLATAIIAIPFFITYYAALYCYTDSQIQLLFSITNLSAVKIAVIYTIIPFVLICLSFSIAPYLALAAIWFPVELKFLPCSNHLINMVYGCTLALFIFRTVYPLEYAKKSLRLNASDIYRATLALAVFSAIVIPTSLHFHLIKYNLANFDLWPIVQYLFIGYFAIALPEEIIFRGCLQGLLEKDMKNNYLALILASVIFGLFHIHKNLNGTVAFGTIFPNWSYVGLASLAGIFYGWVWMSTGKVAASALTHALVNFIRRYFFGTGIFR
ncbi:MAG: Abortive infection protein [Chlamydiales bacterium]|jgi:membrane protease YdiL (CAAX protease family)|nr:Abortive infection protein [Chlamydiales bacterium]